jgi:hypothetical protein
MNFEIQTSSNFDAEGKLKAVEIPEGEEEQESDK